MVYSPSNKCLLMKKMPHILPFKLSELRISSYCSGNSWEPILAWEGRCKEPTRQSFSFKVFCTGSVILPNLETQVCLQSLQSMAYHCYWNKLQTFSWSAPGKQLSLQHSSSSAHVHLHITRESNAETEPCPGHGMGIFTCLLCLQQCAILAGAA